MIETEQATIDLERLLAERVPTLTPYQRLDLARDCLRVFLPVADDLQRALDKARDEGGDEAYDAGHSIGYDDGYDCGKDDGKMIAINDMREEIEKEYEQKFFVAGYDYGFMQGQDSVTKLGSARKVNRGDINASTPKPEENGVEAKEGT